MKIAMLFAHWRDYGEKSSTPMSWEQEFIKMGHEVHVFNLYHDNGLLNPRTRTREYSIYELTQLHWRMQKGEKFDAVYVLDYGPFQSEKLTKENFPGAVLIKESGDEPQSHRMHLQTAHQFDIVLTPDKQSVISYKARGINAIWQTHFADPVFYPRSDIPVQWDVATTCGPRGGGLTDQIKGVLGDRFNNERFFYGEDHAKRLCMGKITFQKSQYGEITRRIFEGMACKRLVITDRLNPATGLEDLFKDGEDIIYYDSVQDAINKIKYYAENDELREKIALNGYNKVLAGHTITSRATELIGLINDLIKT